VARDAEQALMWYSLAAEGGSAQAQFSVGVLYAGGAGVARDLVRAVHWYRSAAEQGDAAAQNNLGVLYATGQGVPQDEVQALHWYRKAAAQGHALARHNLAGLRGGEHAAALPDEQFHDSIDFDETIRSRPQHRDARGSPR
jgi:TPR repeat protein